MSSLPQSIFLLKLQVVFAEAAAEHKQCTLDFRLSTFDDTTSSLNFSDCCGVRLCSIEFDYVRLLDRSITERSIAFDLKNVFVSSIKFDYRTQSSDWVRLGSITERSISYAGLCVLNECGLRTTFVKTVLIGSRSGKTSNS